MGVLAQEEMMKQVSQVVLVEVQQQDSLLLVDLEILHQQVLRKEIMEVILALVLQVVLVVEVEQ